MAKTKAKRPENQISKQDYDDLVKKEDLATAILYPLRYKAKTLREDIGDAQDTVDGLEKDIHNYIEDMGNRIEERREKLRLFRKSTNKKIAEIEATTRMRLKAIEVEKEEIENQRLQAQEQAQFLRVRLGELEQNILLEKSQKKKIIELEDVLVRIKVEHEKVVENLKAEFTRDLRKMKKDYEEKMSLANNCAKKLLKPCITEIINYMRDANTDLAHNMRRISQKQEVLFQKISQIEAKTNHLRYEYELWKDIQNRKLHRCDPHIALTRNYSLERDILNYTESIPVEDVGDDVVEVMKLTPYQILTSTLHSLLRSGDSSTDSHVTEAS